METLNVTAAGDQEQVYRILDNLIRANKEFRILITVPSGEKGTEQTEAVEDVPEIEERDLEKDVTDIIHEIARPYQGLPVFAGGDHDVRGGCGDARFHHEDSLSYHRKEISDYAEPRGACNPPCHRGCMVKGTDGDA